MTIKKPIPITFNLDSRQSVQSVCAVIHIDDKNTETLGLSLMQGGEHIAVSPNSTVTARFVRVKNNTLISDDIACTVQENGNIHIPIDNAAAHMLVGEIKIEVNIVDENDILTMQFPLVIRVNNTILADAEISPESEGTIPELLEEAKEAAESATQAAEAATEAISAKQDKLTAGENITITEENVISASSGSNDYTELENKPSINNVTLSGNKSSDDLSLQDKLTAGQNITIEGNVISAEGGGVTSYEDLTDKPQINGVTLSGNKSAGNLGLQDKLTAGNTMQIGSGIIDVAPYSLNLSFFTHLAENNILYSGYDNSNSSLITFEKAAVIAVTNDDITNSKYSVGANGEIPINKAGTFFNFPIKTDSPPFGKTNSHWVRYYITNDGEIYVGGHGVTLVRRYPVPTYAWSTKNYVKILSPSATTVSGVVNANGTITFTDSEGNSFTTSGSKLVTSGNEQISMGYDEGGFYFLFDDGQEEVNNGTD